MSTQLKATLTQLEATLTSARGTMGEDSPLVYDLRRLMVELTNASRSFDALADYLQRHPEALLRGKAKAAP